MREWPVEIRPPSLRAAAYFCDFFYLGYESTRYGNLINLDRDLARPCSSPIYTTLFYT
jgi:hypothetical protein